VVKSFAFIRFPSLLAVLLPVTSLDARQTNSNPKLAAIPPCDALVAAAKADGIPLDGIAPAGEAGSLSAGASITALVTLRQKGDRCTQWLFYVEAMPPGAKDQSSKPQKPMVLYSCSGHKFEFASAPVPVRLRTVGPFVTPSSKKKDIQTKEARFALDKGFLGLGLEQTAVAVERLKNAKAKGSLWFRNAPFTDAEIKKNLKALGSIRLSTEEERALGGSCPALMSYLNIVQHTEGLNDILMQLVDLPSVWSVVRHGGVNANLAIDQDHLAPADSTAWALPTAQPMYDMPLVLELNKQPALRITLTVTTPLPPLLACGGIVGLLAERPDDRETYLTVRVLSARYSASDSPLAKSE